MKQITDAMAFQEFADRHGEAVWEEVLAPVRKARGEPNYRPTRLMEGLVFQAQIGRILRERFEEVRQSDSDYENRKIVRVHQVTTIHY